MKIVEYLTENWRFIFPDIEDPEEKSSHRDERQCLCDGNVTCCFKNSCTLFSFFLFFYSTLGLSFNADHECCHSFFYATSLETGTQEKNSLKPKNKWAQPSQSLFGLHFAVYIWAWFSQRSSGTLFILHLPKTLIWDHCCPHVKYAFPPGKR